MFDAFLLAAGFGTRLKPLTDLRPKPLVPVCGVPMLSYSLALCARHGLLDVVVNAHHLADQLAAFQGEHEGVRVTVSLESPDILGTGGGLKAVESQLSDTVVVLNGDTLCDVDLTALRQAVLPGGGAMALRPDADDAEHRYGVVAYDDQGIITDLKKLATTEPSGTEYRDSHFTGIHALDRALLHHMSPGFGCIVRGAYVHEVPHRRVAAFRHEGTWLDVGDPSAYLDANLAVLDGDVTLALDPWTRAALSVRGTRTHVVDSAGVQVGPDAKLTGPVWVGVDARIDGRVQRSVIGRRAHVDRHTTLTDCVVWDDALVPTGTWSRRIFAGPHNVDADAGHTTRPDDGDRS